MAPNLSTATGQAYASPTGKVTMTSQSNTLTPESFKEGVMKAHPEYAKATASDGIPYATMDASDFTKRFADKYPDATTKSGHKYADYLPAEPTANTAQPQNQEEKQPGFLQGIVQSAAAPFLQAARVPAGLVQLGVGKLTGSQTDTQNAEKLLSNKPMDFGALGKVSQVGRDENGNRLSGLGAAGQAIGAGLQAAPSLVGAGGAVDIAESAAEKTIPGLIKIGAKTGALLGGSQGAGSALQQGIETNKPGNEVAASTITQGLMGTGAGALLGGALGGASGMVGRIAGKVDTEHALNNAIASVDPELTAGKTAKAYESAARRGTYTGGNKPGIDPRISRIGTELSDINLKPTDPRGNLVKLSRAMDDTEANIKPFENFGVSKGVKNFLVNDLDNLKAQTPREFQGIRESKGVFDSVVDFGKQMVADSKDTIGGYRDARTAFDKQAQLEYPSAYSDNGSINLKNPAGQAIKLVRDKLNENLYQIAPSNSNLQGLISREASIYQAMHNVAPKVAKFDGLSGYEVLLKKYPTLGKIIKIGKYAVPLGAAAGGGSTLLVDHFISGNQ